MSKPSDIRIQPMVTTPFPILLGPYNAVGIIDGKAVELTGAELDEHIISDIRELCRLTGSPVPPCFRKIHEGRRS